jgi:UDP-N-acetylglucosamine 2-epimerase (non-hydrolysing)
MRRILVVIGTRPEAIKMAPLIRRLRDTQDLSVPDVDLNVMQPGQSLSDLTARVLSGMDAVIRDHQPDRILVHGDTTTTFAATLAAYYHKLPVGHVEAGLRTGDIYAPWPEEINRKLADAICDRLYAPTAHARDNLLKEGAIADRILVTGNTVIDALFDVVKGPLEEARPGLKRRFSFIDETKKLLLVTCHRRESFGEGFRSVCEALVTLAERPDVQIVFPVHLNPNVRTAFQRLEHHPRVWLTEPLNYLEFVYMISKCHSILTDSGGIQEEAPSLGKPVFVMRKVTERPEAVAAGTVKLVGTDTQCILDAACEVLDNSAAYAAMSAIHNPYGDGKACERIIASLRAESR